MTRLGSPPQSHDVADGIIAALKSDEHVGKVLEFFGSVAARLPCW